MMSNGDKRAIELIGDRDVGHFFVIFQDKLVFI
jgi:hypothetical protein